MVGLLVNWEIFGRERSRNFSERETDKKISNQDNGNSAPRFELGIPKMQVCGVTDWANVLS
jgi:hypothetical protein